MANDIEALVKSSGWRPASLRRLAAISQRTMASGCGWYMHSGYGGRHSRWRGEDTMAAVEQRETRKCGQEIGGYKTCASGKTEFLTDQRRKLDDPKYIAIRAPDGTIIGRVTRATARDQDKYSGSRG